MRSLRTFASLAFGVLVASGLSACGEPKSTATTWTYDEAVTLQKTDPVQRAAAKKHLEGVQLSIVIENNQFVMTQVGGTTPGVYRGSQKSTSNGIRLHTLTKDGQPVPDPDRTEINLRQPETRRMEMKIEGITASLVRK